MRYVLDEDMAVLRICSTFLLVPAGGPEGLCPPIYILNETAYMLLEQMKEPYSLEELTEAVAEVCDGDRNQILSDTKKMIGALLKKGFIRRFSLESPERKEWYEKSIVDTALSAAVCFQPDCMPQEQ